MQTPGFVALYRKYPDVELPLGFAVPFSVAVVEVRNVSASLVTTGTAGVAKLCTAPNVVPSEFWPIAQK